MKAMIFAAGLGSRLKPLTDTMPKALVPIAGHPMLEHVILKLKAAGFTEIVINIHHFGEQRILGLSYIFPMNAICCSTPVGELRKPVLSLKTPMSLS